MRILFLCNKSPFPPREGGPMAMNMFIEGLIKAGHQVKVLAINSYKFNISPADIPVRYKEKTGIELIDVNLKLNPLSALTALILKKSYHVSRFISGNFDKRLVSVLQDGHFDIVQLETLFMCPYINTIRQYSTAKIVLRAHNIEHLIWERIASETSNPLKKWYLSQLAHSLRKYEEQAIIQVDGILPITSTDAEYFETCLQKQNGNDNPEKSNSSLMKPVRIQEIPFGVDVSDYEYPDVALEFPSLFSLGSMNWIPNQEGIRWFLDQVWPDIHRQFPHLKYYLAGRAMPVWMQTLNLPNVIVLGEIESASRFLAEKAIMIVPLFSGSGIRIKIIEGMAAGKTVISTTLGAEGIKYTHLSNILIADAPCEFFEMISISVSQPGTSEKVGAAARHLIKTEYKPAILIEKLVSFYELLYR